MKGIKVKMPKVERKKGCFVFILEFFIFLDPIIISYFPFSVPEKQEICKILNSESFDEFRTIFSDHVTDEEWNKTKVQIKKKFKDELFDIDDVSNS